MTSGQQCTICGTVTGQHNFSFDYDKKMEAFKTEWFEMYVIQGEEDD